jgi:hypothetical protein
MLATSHMCQRTKIRMNLKTCLAILSGIFLTFTIPVQARPQFSSSEINGEHSELMICDLDGDGLKDLVLLDNTNLSIFYQNPNQGFSREPQQTYSLEPRPCVIWPAKLGGPADSLLIMTSDGVSQLSFTNRTGPPVIRQIIKQSTIIPDRTEGANATYLSLSAASGHGWPLVLVPTADGLQVWQQQGGMVWHAAQVITSAIDDSLLPSVADPGYSTLREFNFSVGDMNGDGRDDLMFRTSQTSQINVYRLYLQQTNGQFSLEPTLVYADKSEPFSWHCWTDLNRDGKVDLIKSVWLNEPSFIPGVPAGKVLVGVYFADDHGRIPSQPQQIFRKNDWTPAVPVVDVDGDGFPDLVLGYNHLDSKEGLSQEITARQIKYSLRFYFFRPGNNFPDHNFPDQPDFQRDIVIRLDHAEGPFDWNLAQNFQRYVRFDGDFNGDGKKDLLVHDHGNTISVYFFVSRALGYSLEPDLQFDCPGPTDEWQIADLNNDGISDLIVKLANEKGYQIFISHK